MNTYERNGTDGRGMMRPILRSVAKGNGDGGSVDMVRDTMIGDGGTQV